MTRAYKSASTTKDSGVPTMDTMASAASASIGLDVLPELLGFNIRRAQIELWRDFGATVSGGEVRPGLFSLLLLVGANPGIAQIDLANQLSVDKASIVALIDRLEEAGWV